MFLQEQCEIDEIDYRNSFFQTIIKADGVYIKYYPAKSGGSILNIEEFRDYMKLHKIKFDPIEFSKHIFSAKQPILIKTGSLFVNPINETMNIIIKDNGIVACCRFIPPSTGGSLLEKHDIKGELEKKGIIFGIDEEEIDNYLTNRVYGKDFIFARGQDPVNGEDGRIIYKKAVDVSRKPLERADGSVDFFSLNIIPKVEKGEILAELVKEVEGIPGMDVKGKTLAPLKVKRLQVKLGQNTVISEDGFYVVSEAPGHLVIEGDKISVSNTFIVNGDLDASTGNINYDGNVEVMGNVISGIHLEATGDISINGTVEGANIFAGGHIILKNGIKGMGKGKLKAGGNIISRFLESVFVEAGGYVSADAILNSDVIAKGDVVVNSKKGYVNGGKVVSSTSISIKNAGSEMGTRTVLEVGIDPELLAELKNLELKVEWLSKKMESEYPMIEFYGKKIKRGEVLPPEKLVQFKIMTLGYKKHLEEIAEVRKKIEEINQSIAENKDGFIDIMDTAYSGVKIVVVNAVMLIKTNIKHSRFIKEGADVRILPVV